MYGAARTDPRRARSVTTPGDVRARLQRLLDGAGVCADIAELREVGGGCVNRAARVALQDGSIVFAKWSSNPPADMFEQEASGLERIGGSGTVRVPARIALDEGMLILEWLEPGPVRTHDWTQFGVALARMHRHTAEHFGAAAANYIGPLPQDNTHSQDWPEFWWTRRLEPQLVRASGVLSARERADIERVASALPMIFTTVGSVGASLLHGDLWSGNAHAMKAGVIALIDPAVYYGHREVDLAMATLFGGFPQQFLSGYEAEWPLEREGLEQRRAVYQLYYLLVHVNLFGAGYTARTLEAARAAMR